MMSSLMQVKGRKKSLLSSAQKTFERLRNKITSLENKLKKRQQELDSCLNYYHEKIAPEKKSLSTTLTDLTKVLHNHYKNSKVFSKKEQNALKEVIVSKVDHIFGLTTIKDADPEINEIYKDLKGTYYHEAISGDFEEIMEEMQEMFKANGLDIDLSNLDPSDGEEEIKEKFFSAMGAAAQAASEQEPEKPKSKKEQQKLLKEQQLEALQKKGLGSIYKQLAKAFHPDLEQDIDKKAEKVELMKKLTCAYENDDLHTLLSLEMGWMSREENGGKIQDDEQLKIYNSILKDQVTELQCSLETAMLHPKYFSIQNFLNDPFCDDATSLEMVYSELQEDLERHKVLLKKLYTSEAEKTIRSLIRPEKKKPSINMDDGFKNLFQFLNSL